MVAVKNVVFAASCVASALAAPSTVSKRQGWGGFGGGGQVGGWGQGSQGQGQGGFGGQGQSQGQGGWGNWGQPQGQGQGQGQGGFGGQDQGQGAGAATGAGAGAPTESSAPAGSGSSSGSSDVPSVPTTGGGESSSGSSAGNSSATSGSTGVESSAGTSSLAAVSGETLTSSSTGNAGSYYYSHWVETNSGATMTVGDGSYSLEWTEASGNVVSGIGWNPASARTVTYQADVQASGNWYISLYGWTKSPLVEFYIVESYGSYDPSSAASAIGTAEIDGGTYTLLQTTRTNQPSIEGTSTFQQYWAVRNEHRTSGSIDFGAHIDAWKGAGLELGSFDYMILATEGYQSSGSSTVSLS